MIGAIAGDIIGSVYEFHPIKTTDFPLFKTDSFFTDDSVLTIALAESILTGKPYLDVMLAYVKRYPGAGYGGRFWSWSQGAEHLPYNSFGNGAAMRISPVGFAYSTLEEVLKQAEKATAITHNHPEGIKGGLATAAAIFLARKGNSKDIIKAYIQSTFQYNLDRKLDDIRPSYGFDESCQGTVPEAIIAFLESDSYERTIRKAVSLGGDADTLACIAGGIAQAFYGGIPTEVEMEAYNRLDEKLAKVVKEFTERFPH
jgi:ADP-ribosylglycohydrolase